MALILSIDGLGRSPNYTYEAFPVQVLNRCTKHGRHGDKCAVRLRIRISLVPYRSEHVEYDGRTMFHGAFPLQIFYTSPVPSRSWTIGLFAPEQIPAKACLPERLDCSI